jgi:hypothetical protein
MSWKAEKLDLKANPQFAGRKSISSNSEELFLVAKRWRVAHPYESKVGPDGVPGYLFILR